jgi:hypothetical protein
MIRFKLEIELSTTFEEHSGLPDDGFGGHTPSNSGGRKYHIS